MPVSAANCCLCGAPIDETQAWPEWMGSFRAVYVANEQWRRASVSGVGERQPLGDRVPNPIRLIQDEFNGGEGPDHFLYPEHLEIDITSTHLGGGPGAGPRPLWGFPFHSSCWDLFNAAREAQQKPPYITQVLFEALLSYPRNGITDFGHNYGGIAGYCMDLDAADIVQERHLLDHLLMPGEEPRLVYFEGDSAALEMQRQDPMYNDELRSVFEGAEESASQQHPHELEQEDSPNANDIFRRFPFELLQMIVSELSPVEVITLRQSSTVFRHLPLSESFWRSQFLPGGMFECLFDALKDGAYNRSVSWSTAYHRLIQISSSASLKNRRRVWKLSQVLGDICDKAAGIQDPFGDIDAPGIESRSESSREDDEVAEVRVGRCLRPFNQSFTTGSRVLRYYDDAYIADPMYMSASVVRIQGKTYVSGITWGGMCWDSGYTGHRESVVLCWLGEHETCRIVGLHLALDQQGIRGICAVTSKDRLLSWAGDHHGLPKQRVLFQEDPDRETTVTSRDPGQRRFRLMAGCDALKFVYMSTRVGDRFLTDNLSLSTLSLRDTALWYPDIPPPHLSFAGIGMRDLEADGPDRQDRPLTMLMFGGYDGEHLRHVTHLAVLSQDGHGIMGLEATYDCLVDGKNTMFLGCANPCRPLGGGARPAALRRTEMSFDVSAGEEITGLEIHQGQYVLGFKVYTTKGRSIEFPTPDHGGPSMKARAQDHGEIVIAFRPAFHKVVGFLARAGSRGIQNLGLVQILV